MEQLSAFLSKFNTKSTTVAINVSSRSEIEVAEFDKNGIMQNYAIAPIQYNAFTKEIENITDFESTIKRIFSELNLSLSSKAYISIPTFIIENETLPAAVMQNEDDIKTYLTSTAERNYIFKKYDPSISYYVCPTGDEQNVNVIYTALRQDEYNKMMGVFEALGLNIAAVDSSYSSFINGVIATKKVNPANIENNQKWNIINVTSNSFSVFAMQGKNLISIYEEPLAVKSFTEEEIYQVITNALELALEKYPANQLVFVSQSDNVYAEHLAETYNTDIPKTYIEDNKYRKQLVDELGYNITQSNKTRISLELVGAVYWHFNLDGFKFNFVNSSAAASVTNDIESITIPWVGGQSMELTPQRITKCAIVYALILILLGAGAYFLGSTLKSGQEQEQSMLSSKVQELESQLDKSPKSKGVTESEFLRTSYDNNINFKKSYSAIAREIPDMVWIEEVQLSDSSKLFMKGRSYRMDDILNYYDSLNKFGKFSNLKISSLGISNHDLSTLIKSDMEKETTYEFSFGENFYVDPKAVQAPQDGNTDGDKKNANAPAGPPGPPTPPAPAPNNTNNNANNNNQVVPPAPTEIPKEDN